MDMLFVQGVVFVAVGGMRGAVSLILAQSVLTMESATEHQHHDNHIPEGASVQELLAMDALREDQRKTERKVCARVCVCECVCVYVCLCEGSSVHELLAMDALREDQRMTEHKVFGIVCVVGGVRVSM